MTVQPTSRLEELARSDTAVAPLALLQAETFRVAADPAWAQGVPTLHGEWLERGIPLLQGATLVVELDRLRTLLRRLGEVLAVVGTEDGEAPRVALESSELDSLELLQASITQESARLEAIGERLDVDGSVLSVIAHQATLPLLLACGRQAAPLLAQVDWPRGFCPVCAAWPTLAEMRGLDRQLFLRCGRCASAWRFSHLRCAFCGNDDHRTQSYFASKEERESRRAAACDHCHGYLKTVATLGPLDVTEIALQDLRTLELDVVALEHGYTRPESPGFSLTVRVEPAVRSARYQESR